MCWCCRCANDVPCSRVTVVVPVKWPGDDSHDVLIQRAVAAGLRGPFAAGGGFRAVAVPRNNRLEDNLNMAELTAVEVLALSALMEGRPMTSAELSRRVSDMGMHLNSDDAAVTLRSMAGMGMAERTPRPAWASSGSPCRADPGWPPAPRPQSEAGTRRGGDRIEMGPRADLTSQIPNPCGSGGAVDASATV